MEPPRAPSVTRIEPPVEAPRLAPRRSARLQGLPPPPQPLPPPPPPQPRAVQLSARCSPADAGAPCWFVALPDDVLFRVFVALPADARARCASVCRAWAHILLRGADAWRLWTRLDLSKSSGVTCTRSDAVLEGAAALARGRLQELNLDDHGSWGNPEDEGFIIDDYITLDALLRVLRGSPELQVLALTNELAPSVLQQLLATAPRMLQRLDADHVTCHSAAESLPLLRAEPPYGPLRMRVLQVTCLDEAREEGIGAVVGAHRFGAAVAHAKLRELHLIGITWTEPAALEALADALLARTCRVEQLALGHRSGMSPAYLPALARLLAGRDGAALTEVHVVGYTSLFAGVTKEDIEPVCAALRRSTLTKVLLGLVGLVSQATAALRQAARAAPQLQLDV